MIATYWSAIERGEVQQDIGTLSVPLPRTGGGSSGGGAGAFLSIHAMHPSLLLLAHILPSKKFMHAYTRALCTMSFYNS